MNKAIFSLFFCLDYKGHHMEYVNYQYLHAVKNSKNAIFLLNPNCKQHLKLYSWPESNHVRIEYFTNEEISSLDNASNIRKSFKACKLLKKYDKIYKPNVIISNNLINFFPAALFTSIKAKLHGIVYSIPYHQQTKGIKRLISHYGKPTMFQIARCVRRVWLLNDTKTPILYNRVFHSNKFHHLSDPIDSINFVKSINNKEDSRIRFEHIGGMSERKGTFTILEAIMLMTPEEQSKFVFSFSGRLSPKDEMRFYEYYNRLYDKNTVEYNPGLIEQEKFNTLISKADCILIPYKNVENSSGILGHAALHHKPVIGPSNGLLGQLIHDYELGITLSNLSPLTLKEAILYAFKFDANNSKFDQYVTDNSVENFARTIFQD